MIGNYEFNLETTDKYLDILVKHWKQYQIWFTYIRLYYCFCFIHDVENQEKTKKENIDLYKADPVIEELQTQRNKLI